MENELAAELPPDWTQSEAFWINVLRKTSEPHKKGQNDGEKCITWASISCEIRLLLCADFITNDMWGKTWGKERNQPQGLNKGINVVTYKKMRSYWLIIKAYRLNILA
jgi:hypothetical protein